MDQKTQIVDEIRDFINREMSAQNVKIETLAAHTGASKKNLEQWLSGHYDSKKNIADVSIILFVLGHDLRAWLRRRKTPSPQIREALGNKLVQKGLAIGNITTEEIEAIIQLDQVGYFRNKTAADVMNFLGELRSDAGISPSATGRDEQPKQR